MANIGLILILAAMSCWRPSGNIVSIFFLVLASAGKNIHGKFVLCPASRLGVSDRVSSHPQIIEEQADIAVQVGHFVT
ncbi:MAG: hypothetical protein NOF05_20280 [Candidatus Accumulibacter phosphatis]|uniref:hypothetical protein n=1 Tax=Candidatus Accumulibacter TaxID=327159 RepID=UPI00110AB90F|nr:MULTISPECIES: hypothetical protein [Candidatus Accumulibacter]MBL8402445.1 hypothetical protein [Accumulibacter sp.]MBN8519721.1 hypothetical protein [Accumulibacter sp.]MBO3709654.1 hypothetical protein [Accumulibacter sp.]MCC2869350.1 hypothetical protein [Candidatus Accumulibacter phosphatis]MCM8579822.1 hypothetical protein [Accumulibacter sp.]